MQASPFPAESLFHGLHSGSYSSSFKQTKTKNNNLNLLFLIPDFEDALKGKAEFQQVGPRIGCSFGVICLDADSALIGFPALMFLQFVLIVFALMSCMIDQSSKLVHGVEWRALRGLMLGLFCPDVLADGCALVSLLCSGAWCLECLALVVGDGVDGLARGGDGKGWSCLPLVVVDLPCSMADIVRTCADGLEQSAEMVAECLEPMA